MQRITSSLLSLVVLLAGCGGAARDTSPTGRSDAAARGALTASARPALAGSASPVPSSESSSRAGEGAAGKRPPAGGAAVAGNWLKAQVLDDETWGPGCGVSPHRGLPCRIPFDGIANLASSETGTIFFEAYEDDAAIPAAVRALPAHKGVNRFCTDTSCAANDARLVYTASRTARFATFFVVLRAADGRILASSHPMTFRVI